MNHKIEDARPADRTQRPRQHATNQHWESLLDNPTAHDVSWPSFNRTVASLQTKQWSSNMSTCGIKLMSQRSKKQNWGTRTQLWISKATTVYNDREDSRDKTTPWGWLHDLRSANPPRIRYTNDLEVQDITIHLSNRCSLLIANVYLPPHRSEYVPNDLSNVTWFDKWPNTTSIACRDLNAHPICWDCLTMSHLLENEVTYVHLPIFVKHDLYAKVKHEHRVNWSNHTKLTGQPSICVSMRMLPASLWWHPPPAYSRPPPPFSINRWRSTLDPRWTQRGWYVKRPTKPTSYTLTAITTLHFDSGSTLPEKIMIPLVSYVGNEGESSSHLWLQCPAWWESW